MRKTVIVVGAGLGGISAALTLSQRGYDVSIYEKNAKIGGKLNILRAQGYTFDLGPSILTLPQVFEKLFEGSGRQMSDYITIHPVRPHWRNFFEDGKVIDLYPEREMMDAQARKAGEDPRNLHQFLEYAGRLYDLIDAGYFRQGLDTSREFSEFYGLGAFPKFDLLNTMHGAVKRRLKSRYLRDIFDYFSKYVGSSAYKAPAFMNCLPTIQYRHDLWYVQGGMYGIAEGLGRLLDELRVPTHLGCEVTRIQTKDARVTGVVTSDGAFHAADIVVSNMEVIPAYRRLLNVEPAFLRRLERRYEPACSGLILDIGLDRQYPQLAHHNFFYSSDQRAYFSDVYGKKRLPQDPTIYLVAASRSDSSVAPPGCDCLKILPHIPYINERHPLTAEDYAGFKQRVLEKLERMGLTDLRRHIVFEHSWTPLDIRDQYYSNKGSIYGVVSDRWRNLAFKHPKQSTRYPNLFFVGGSVNPGGGMPMVVLCGQKVADKVVAWDQ